MPRCAYFAAETRDSEESSRVQQKRPNEFYFLHYIVYIRKFSFRVTQKFKLFAVYCRHRSGAYHTERNLRFALYSLDYCTVMDLEIWL